MSGETILLLIWSTFCELIIIGCGLFIWANWYINFHRNEDLPWNKFLPYLKCEFITGVHWFPYAPDSDYKVCQRCDAVRRREKLNEKKKDTG
jgi:hypothetical protein